MSIKMLMVMRTTLTVDDDVLALARQRAAQLHAPLVEIINRALRRGLAEELVPVAAPTVVFTPSTVTPLDEVTYARRVAEADAAYDAQQLGR